MPPLTKTVRLSTAVTTSLLVRTGTSGPYLPTGTLAVAVSHDEARSSDCFPPDRTVGTTTNPDSVHSFFFAPTTGGTKSCGHWRVCYEQGHDCGTVLFPPRGATSILYPELRKYRLRTAEHHCTGMCAPSRVSRGKHNCAANVAVNCQWLPERRKDGCCGFCRGADTTQ